jgi:Putative auto-transporter adhesin, head GIN domain
MFMDSSHPRVRPSPCPPLVTVKPLVGTMAFRIASVLSAATAALFALASTIAVSHADVVVTGSGKLATQARTVAAFTSIEIVSSIKLEFRIGPKVSVEITADDNLLRYLTTVVRKDTLMFDVVEQPGLSIHTRSPMRAVVTAPKLSALSIDGSGDATLSGLSGARFAIAVNGSGNVRVAGTAKTVQITVEGSGDVDAKDLIASSAAVAIEGSGQVSVHASASIAATITGSGDIDVYGQPTNVSRYVEGSGKIRLRKASSSAPASP